MPDEFVWTKPLRTQTFVWPKAATLNAFVAWPMGGDVHLPVHLFQVRKVVGMDQNKEDLWGTGMRLLLSMTFVALACSAGYSQEEKGTVAGAGWVSCAEFAQSYKEDPRSTEEYFFAWAQGYMSGVNQASWQRKNLRGWRIEQQKQHIRSYCDEHPLANYGKAVQDVFDNLPNR